MSVEALAIARLVEDGPKTLRAFYANGVTSRDFLIYSEEFEWVEKRLAQKKTVNKRVFRQRFADFEWIGVPQEDASDLASELKEERAFEEINELIATFSERLERDNALELAIEARELLGQVTRKFVPMSDSILEEGWEADIEEMRRYMQAAKMGAPIGLNTGFAHLDHHLGGLLPGQFIEILGRTGEGKSLKTYAIALNCKLQGAKVGIFTPELTRHEVLSRVHTLASARPEVKAALGLKHSFRNRALLQRRGFNLKSYQRFLEYYEQLPGRTYLLSGTGLHEQMSVGYIEDRIVEYELDLVIVDPIYLLKPVRTTRDGNPYQEVAWTAEALHRLSETYNVPIIFTNQAHLDGAGGDAPGKDKSFGTKGMVHLADVVLGVKHISEEHRMICRCSKSRFGQSGFRYELMLHANTGAIKEMTPLAGNYLNGKDDDWTIEDLDDAVETVTTAKKKGKVKSNG